MTDLGNNCSAPRAMEKVLEYSCRRDCRLLIIKSRIRLASRIMLILVTTAWILSLNYYIVFGLLWFEVSSEAGNFGVKINPKLESPGWYCGPSRGGSSGWPFGERVWDNFKEGLCGPLIAIDYSPAGGLDIAWVELPYWIPWIGFALIACIGKRSRCTALLKAPTADLGPSAALSQANGPGKVLVDGNDLSADN